MSDRVLFFKLGGIGDAIDSCVMLGGVRKKHPQAKITAIVRDARHAQILKAAYRKDTGQPVCDFVRPASHDLHWWRFRRNIKLSWEAAWEMETRHASWDYAYDARAYVGKVYRFQAGIPEVIFPRITNSEDEAAYSNPTSLWTHKLVSRNQTVIELMNASMNLQASWGDVDIGRMNPKAIVPDDYVILSNATDTKEQNTKQWSFTRFAEVAHVLAKSGLSPVQLGIKRDKPIPNCLDLRGETNLLEAIEVVRNAKLVVSIEGGIARMAGLVGTPSVIIFTSTPASLFRVPNSMPVVQSACALGHCFWRTGEWMTECMLEKSLHFPNNESLPICAGEIQTDTVLEAVNTRLCEL